MRTVLFWAITQRSNVNYLPTFRDNLSVPSSRTIELDGGTDLEGEPTGCLETSARNYHCTIRDSPEYRSSHVHLVVNIL